MSSDEIDVMNTSVAQEEISPENHQRRGESDSHSDDNNIRNVVRIKAMDNMRYRQRKKELKPPKPQAKTAAERCKAYRDRQKLRQSAVAEAITPAPVPSKKPKIVPNSTCTANLLSPNDGPEYVLHAAQIHNQHNQQNVHDDHELPNRESMSDVDSDMDIGEHFDGPPIEFDNDFVPPYSGYVNHKFAHKQFQKMFVENPFGYACSVCDRLWFEKDLKKATSADETMLKKITALANIADAKLCTTCKRSMQNKKIPTLATFNGFKYPERPAYLPQLNLIAERLISPRLPFMQIRRIRHVNGQFCISGQIINVPVSVDNMVSVLPRHVDDDFCINVHIKKK
ncbi:uncharacterized protein Dana_GF26351 [Drosophila ananassae]|uniref:DUF6570 domain-containing protein n=1 Tax=Drosophila ananassae TaxID=7217 RepID=A0A0P9BVS0_DROAN|nr:uncharacterized protein LOC26513760 [Drosophila ananassae]XP_032312022.1 uncharacterized protein LOC26513760 [Drosophila ananassae]KPU75573.1 uncharacterized protein Dana_GF26351 [Drosophila ananassae]